MAEGLVLSSADRLLVLAPHPDDESLGSGGLIQQALGVGAGVQVVIATDGDNNPWPQRWLEKRLRIDAAARARWGTRRRFEALDALRVLGLGTGDVAFLGWPDLGLTQALRQRPQELLAPLREAWRRCAPTHVVLPLARDTHPDHSALHLLARAVARGLAARPLGLGFAVHGGRDVGDLVLTLTPEAFARKRTAVLQHTSQQAFGKGRLLRFVLPQEAFVTVDFAATEPAQATADALPKATHQERVSLLGIRRDGSVCVASDVLDAAAVHESTGAGLVDGRTGDVIAWPPTAGTAPALPPSWHDVVELWWKCERRRRGMLVFDRQGWQALAAPAR